MTDFLLLEKISQLNSKNPKPRLLHQKGVAAGGVFSPYMPLSDYTSADFLQDPQREVPVIARFSRLMGEKGSGDSLRDTRGFAVRFQTGQGSYDLLCHNLPCYYIRSPAQFPDMVQSLTGINRTPGEDSGFWKFLSQNPEAVNLAMWLFSDKGTLKSYRFMEGYSVNTYQWINSRGETLYVRYKWSPLSESGNGDEKRKGISYQEAEFLAGFSPDCCISDLALAVEEKRFPAYELEVQMMDRQQAENCGFDFLSVTLYWPEEICPSKKIGKMVLNSILSAEECEKLCFAPGNLVPGIEFGNREFLEIMDFAHRDGGRQRGASK